MSLLDYAALAWFLALWVGYTVFVDRRARHAPCLLSLMDARRRAWMAVMVQRDNRMVDASLVGNLVRTVVFLASTTVFILAGLFAVLGATERAIFVVSALPFAAEAPRSAWELRLLVLIGVFVYAFFKFTWALRQFNLLGYAIGSAPRVEDTAVDARAREGFADEAAQVASQAARHMNRGLRAYYFGLAAFGWFLHPVLFLAAATWVVVVLHRREFRSPALGALAGMTRAARGSASEGREKQP